MTDPTDPDFALTLSVSGLAETSARALIPRLLEAIGPALPQARHVSVGIIRDDPEPVEAAIVDTPPPVLHYPPGVR